MAKPPSVPLPPKKTGRDVKVISRDPNGRIHVSVSSSNGTPKTREGSVLGFSSKVGYFAKGG